MTSNPPSDRFAPGRIVDRAAERMKLEPPERRRAVTLTESPAGAVGGLFLYACESIPRSGYDSYDEWLHAVRLFMEKLSKVKP